MTAATSQELKGLQTQLSKSKADLDVLLLELEHVRVRVDAATKHRNDLERRILTLQQDAADPIVTEHAMLRWLERVEGINLDELKGKILDKATIDAIKFAKTGKVSKCGHKIVFKNNVVVTVE